jgi:hypothetical protein
MAYDVSELQKRINGLVNEDPTVPTAGGSTWNLYLNTLNIAQHEWQETYQWRTLYTEINTLTSQSTGNVTLSLPNDFRKIDGFLKVCDQSVTNSYKQIDPEKKDQYSTSDQYFYILGSPNGYKMVINPGTHGSGASIFYSYWANAASLASGSDVSKCPDPSYLVFKSSEYIMRSRDDSRYVDMRADADRALARMLEFEQSFGVSYDNTIRTVEQGRYNFRLGRD